MNNQEVFKPLPHPFDNYEAGDQGSIRTKSSGRILSAPVGRDGYVRVGLAKGFGNVKIAYVHRLVAMVHCAGDTTLTVNHKDLCKHNNAATNLEWVSLSDNHKHRWAQRPEDRAAHGRRIARAITAVRLCDGGRESYPSGKQAAIAMGAAHKAANICNAVHRGSVAYGRTWTFDV